MENEFLKEYIPCTSDLERARAWTFCVYPDSAPADWKAILCRTGLPFAVSPLHDKDLQMEASEAEKKPHWHCMLMYGNTTTLNCIKTLLEPLNCTRPFAVTSPRGLYRYFIHADNPEKYQYPENSRECYNGLDPLDLMSKTDVQKCMNVLENIIFEHDFSDYWAVLRFLSDNDINDLRMVFRTHTIHFNALLTSIRCSRKDWYNKQDIIDTALYCRELEKNEAKKIEKDIDI